MCFGWKFKLVAFYGTQYWFEEPGLGLDGCTSNSIIGSGNEPLRMGKHRKKKSLGIKVYTVGLKVCEAAWLRRVAE